MSELKIHLLSSSVKAKIDDWKQRYPAEQQRSAVMSALRFAQEENNNWLSQDLIEAVADYLSMPRIAAVEIATFYTMYNLQPVGRHLVEVCTSISCMLSGCDKIVDHIQQKYNVEVDGTSADNKITLRRVECLASCTSAPMMQIGKKYYENLSPEKVNSILDELE